MADPELAAIRAQRMAELQQQQQFGGGSGPSQEQQQKQQEMQERREDMKNSILSQVLDQQARARLNTIALIKPERAAQIERVLIQMAQSGQLSSKLNEERLKSLIAQFGEEKTTTVKFDRRRTNLDLGDDSDWREECS